MSSQASQFAQVGDQLDLVIQFVDQDNVIINLSTATELTLKILYPDGTTEDHTATLYTDGLDGKIVYTTSADDLDQVGFYRLQGKAVVGGEQFSTRNNPSSAQNTLEVFGNVDDA